MLQKALPLPLLLAGLLTLSTAMAEETQPEPMTSNNAASKLAKINPVFASKRKGCPMHQIDGKSAEGNGEPCPFHDEHHGHDPEHCDHESHK